ncbi:MAG: FAD binding domain-containing protein [Clostridiales bacterium]|nr:FAD binding domain-containing protein [Candidatus Cacconaster stercorequi]
MTIHHPKTALEAVTLRKKLADTAVYLSGGTDDLRLGGSAEGKELIDINGLDEKFDTITVREGKVWIGARCTLQQIVKSELIPAFIRESAAFCASFARRNSATIGGNVALRRSDSYMAAALTAAEAVLDTITPHGEEEKAIGEYLKSDCKCLIRYIVVDQSRTGFVKRFGNTSSSHAALIAAHSGNVYALSVSGSVFAYGSSPELGKSMTFADDITGSAAYKKYLAETVFTLGR